MHQLTMCVAYGRYGANDLFGRLWCSRYTMNEAETKFVLEDQLSID